MNVNFFDWMRQGVKQSVLLGVGDAIETLGTPPESSQGNANILAFLQDEGAGKKGKRVAASGRKRLGKSLNDLNPES